MYNHIRWPALVVGIIFITTFVQSQEDLTCDIARGWTYLGRGKCYKAFYQNDARAWDRARDICKSYGSKLVQINDQYENHDVGRFVEDVTGTPANFWTGLSNVADPNGCTTCTTFKWEMGPEITHNQAFWQDNMPDDADGDCIFASRNNVKYIYDRPFAWRFDKCVRKRPFVCEKMAIPQGCFACFSGGFARAEDECNGRSDCSDGSDEINCPNRYHFYHNGDMGSLTSVPYLNSQTYTWAIETPLGTNAYVQFQNFQTEQLADFVTVYVGSIIETTATRLARISGSQGNRAYRSYNNMMFIKFSTDSSETASGFTATWGSESVQSSTVSLTAMPTSQVYNIDSFSVAGMQSFVSNRDYVVVINAQTPKNNIITVEIEDMDLHDSDMIMFYDGDDPQGSILATMCNVGCDNSKLVFSTGASMSVFLRTGSEITRNVIFSFKYRQGCYFETNADYGEVFSPGFPAALNYPNNLHCEWHINSQSPISLAFSPNTVLRDQDFGREDNGDFLKIFDDGNALHPNAEGFGTTNLQSRTIRATTGSVRLEFRTGPTRTARGFMATWSIGCENPMYDANTIVSTGTAEYYYTARMTLQCAQGYDFLQAQIPSGTSQVQLECGYKGEWLNYKAIPRCSPKYCGDVPNIGNGYIAYSTGSVYGSMAHYECYPGSTIAGSNSNITCQDNGRWSLEPSCNAATCSYNLINRFISNGQGELSNGDGYEIGSIVTYTCDEGYELVGEPILLCQNDGQYSSTTPSCQALTCYLPEIAMQVAWASSLISYGSSATLTCMTGYEVSDQMLNPIICQANRTVTQAPECVDVDECSTLSPCSNMCTNIKGSFVCSCPPGYQLDANNRDCNNINECLIPSLNNCDGRCNDQLGSYSCLCDPPYTLYTADGTSGYMLPAGESGLLPTDTFYINHTCVLQECPTPDDTVANAVLMTKRLHHRVGDYIEYQCDRGYIVRRSVLSCEDNGIWSGTIPDCINIQCPSDAGLGGLQNPSAYKTGPYDFGEQLYLNCTVAGQEFSNYRFCTYNPQTDTYELQGSPYDCGDIDCGTPEAVPGSTYLGLTTTTYGSSFQFTCQDTLSGSSQQGDTTVRCMADGNWDFGSLTCVGLSCVDPGFPAGGDIVATSLADQTQVNFVCNRDGYALSHTNPLVCNGNSFAGSPTVPTCNDNTPPVFTNCDTEITVQRYAYLAPRLPNFILLDNTGVDSLVISPVNANSTLYVTTPITVLLISTDFADNTATCTVSVKVEDETPPTLTCPTLRTVQLSADDDRQSLSVTIDDLTTSDNEGVRSKDIQPAPPTEYTTADLYNTYTYTARVDDNNNNVATCRSQVFVTAAACSDASFKTPLNSVKVCTDIAGGRRCTVTCDSGYTLEFGNSQSFTCLTSSGQWNDWVPACVRDVIIPEISCPSSQTLFYIDSTQSVDFTTLPVSRSDNNDMSTPVFQPEAKNFTVNDLYQTTDVQVTVSDAANNVARCNFQYTLLPSVCSPSALPITLNAKSNDCLQTNSGYQCTVECNDGFVIRGFGQSRTISCTTGNPWQEIFPACIPDTTPPSIICPNSQPVYIKDGDDSRTITFNDVNSGFSNYVASDNSGIAPSVQYIPSQLFVSASLLNLSPQTIQVAATDGNGNRGLCTFQVMVLADVCSPLSLPTPINGRKDCTDLTGNGGSWQCNMTCNNGYTFYDRLDSSIITSCSAGNTFNTYVPGCVSTTVTREKEFVGTLEYEFLPNNGANSIPESCLSYYSQQQELRESTMEGSLVLACESAYEFQISVRFFSNSYRAELLPDTNGNNRIVKIYSDYSITNDDPSTDTNSVYTTCSSHFFGTVDNVNSRYTFKENIAGDGNLCPTLEFLRANQTRAETTCPSPFYVSISDNTICSLCPAGTESTSTSCSLCDVGEYSSGSACTSCSGTTRYPGATSASACVAACSPGTISPTGYQPCYRCALGSYSLNTQTCTSCPAGTTTAFTGSPSDSSCVSTQSVTVTEPCGQGTTPDGSGGCDLCPYGTYGVSSTTTCQSCFPSGTSTHIEGATSSSACYATCSNGYFSSNGRAPCTACPIGSSFVNSTYCAPCPSGSTTAQTGALSCIPETSLRVLCPRGTTRNSNTALCEKCPIGTYNSIEEGSCVSCTGTKSTFMEGATDASMCFDKCIPGFFSVSGMSPCQPCGIGNYWVSPTECTACPDSGTTATSTAASISECVSPCSAGEFSYSGYNLNGACRQCPPSHYQSSTGAISCNRCPTNQFSTLPGGRSSTSCLNADSLCLSNPCQNSGTCRADFNTYVCDCAIGYYGNNCQFSVNYCNSNPCYNGGTCTYDANGHSCQCPAGATGTNCQTIVESCVVSVTSPTCLNDGHCINYVDGPQCLCREGFAGERCATNTSICITNPCNSVGTSQCEDVSFGKNLRRKCVCRAGYEGKDCEINTDDCASNPCINDGTCQDLVNGFFCRCKGGYSGTYCQNRGDRCIAQSCNSANSICVDDYSLEEPRCICEPGYAFGTYVEYVLQLNTGPDNLANLLSQSLTLTECREACDVSQSSCQGFVYNPGNSECYILNAMSNMIATAGHNTYTKTLSNPDDDFWTVKYNIDSPGSASQIGNSYHDEERLTTLNGRYDLNICGGTTPLDARCCLAGGSCDEDNLQVGMQCNAEGSICTQGTILVPCPDYEVQFKCAAHRVFSSNLCNIKRDYCDDSPCQNGGRCEILQGQGYSCLCAAGYTGLNCQTDIDDCVTNPCQNDGVCVDRVNNFECQCATGFEGRTCSNPINYCNQNAVTCNFRGQCRNLVDGYFCVCSPGYEGNECETEIDYCRSDPCIHGATCTPSLNTYSCACADGYFGRHCENVVDNCQSNGLQCQATCLNIFNGYYCDCPANTYGTNCENQPAPCQNYNKCLNGGSCSTDGEFMNCTCPTKFEGDGCEMLADLCGGGNMCQNNAVCTLTSNAYTCDCPDGYSGTNCQIDIDECNPNPCTGGAQCYNDIDRYFCICPIGMTGRDCSRPNDPNYDLFFHHPMGLGYAWLPYYTQVNNLSALSISVWVRFAEVGGQGVYLTKFIGPELSTATRFFDLTERGVRIYRQDGPSDHFYLQFTREASINNGHWHLVHVLYDMAAGNVKLYADTILSTERTAANLVITDTTYKMWVVLGCYFDPFSHRCTGNSFYGYLSQINWYNRLLTYNKVGNVQGELPSIYSAPQLVLSSGAFLVWNGYEMESGVDRMIPSAAKGQRCGEATRNPPCSFYIASEVPSVTGCPADITVDSDDRLTTVNWVEPVFRNLGSGGEVMKTYLPGATFSWGEYENQYIATSPLGYKAYCTFRIFVRKNPCQRPANPFSGNQNCQDNDPLGWKGCRIGCTNSNTASLRIDRDHPDIYTCGPSGQWNVAQPFKKFRYPSCGEVKEEARIDVRIRVVYDITTAACEPAKTNLEVRIAEEMIKLHNLYTNTLCRQTNCTDVQVTITCNLQPGTDFTYITLVNIVIPEADARTTLDGEVISVEEFLSFFILADKVLNFDSIADGRIVEESFYINPMQICPTGQVLRDDACVECGPGNFYNSTGGHDGEPICDDCPLGFYQNQYGQMECDACPGGTTTEMTGTYDLDDCKTICTAGQYFDYLTNGCLPCAIGYFQPLEGQFMCDYCGAGFTTEFTGSISREKCKATCESGYQISTDTCIPCPIGQYRNADDSRVCVNCPIGLITENEASRLRSDCSIPACLEGFYYNAPTNSCIPCGVGEYQDEVYQTSCKSCGDPLEYSTLDEGSQSESDCFFYCPSGNEVFEEGTCQICPVGSYKDNAEGLQNNCSPCAEDYRTPSTGATSSDECTIFKCPVGYKANIDNTGCDECPIGFYQDVEYSTDCEPCDDNYSTRSTASISRNACETYCPDGYEKLATGACSPCLRGFYKDNDEGLFSNCTACDDIFTTVAGAAVSVLDCNIRTCPPGTKRNTDDSGCVGCELGTYQPSAYQQNCITCTTGSTRQVNSTRADQCEVFCSSGEEKGPNGCTTCPRGYYKDNSIGLFEECTLCPTEYITPGAGATSINDCTIANCTSGQYIDGQLCLPCAIGFFQPNWWQSSCIQCGTDKTTEEVGAENSNQCILVCQPGFEDAGGFCQPCARGYWKSEEAAAACKPCPTGSTTDDRGSISNLNCTLPACLEGYYLDRANSQCLRCPYDYYQNEIWMESCKQCPDGKVTLEQGASDSTQCVANCSSGRDYNPITGGCDFCEIGKYRNQADRSQTDCQMCPIEYITANRGSENVGECSIANCSTPGTYRDATVNQCKQCPLDFYNNQRWRTACTRCQSGYGTKLEGSDSSTDCVKICDPGTYLGTSGACLVCPRGTFKAESRTEQCTPCPNGLLTANTGQTSSATCVISPCTAGQEYEVSNQQCTNCPIGTYQPNAGQFECVDCPFLIKYTPRTGAISENECRSPCSIGEEFNQTSQSCVPCRRGYYQPQSNQFTCIQCPLGSRYTVSLGSTTVNQCFSPCDSNSGNDCSINATCSVTSGSPGYTCTCFTNFDNTGSVLGRECIHKCDRGYCRNGGTCVRDPRPSCSCSEWYEGNQCQTRIRAEDLSDDTLEIIVPVAIGVGGLILFLIALAVCLLCWTKRKSKTKGPTQYSDYHGDRVDKASLHSYDYGQRPFYNGNGSRLMLAPYSEMQYANSAFKGDVDQYSNSNLDNAVYQA